MKHQIFFLLVIVFICSVVVSAQKWESGGINDLKGLTKIWIPADVDTKNRARIIEVVSKAKLPDVKFVDDGDEAEIVLIFGGSTENVITGVIGTTITRVPLEEGAGYVFVDGKSPEKLRLVLTMSNEQQSRLEKRPVTKFAEAFVKAYKQANGLPLKK